MMGIEEDTAQEDITSLLHQRNSIHRVSEQHNYGQQFSKEEEVFQRKREM